MVKANQVTTSTLFQSMQRQMMAKMELLSSVTSHPTTQGDISELGWLTLFQDYLPRRYRAEKAFIIDSQNHVSDQIDVVIFDPHYSPFLFKSDGAIYVPAESVYAVFEVKPNLSKDKIVYAGDKAKSVRSLHRTTAPFATANGPAPARPLNHIITGILTTRSSWKEPFGAAFKSSLASLDADAQLDIGCCLQAGSFVYEDSSGTRTLQVATKDSALMHFFLKLLKLLQKQATVPAIVLDDYISQLPTGN